MTYDLRCQHHDIHHREISVVTSSELAVEVLGPWSLATCRRFWEGFAPAALPSRNGRSTAGLEVLRSVFRVERDWSRAEVEVIQDGSIARIRVEGDGNLDTAAVQAARFLSLDVDARAWPDVGLRDPVIADAQRQLPGLRPCGFHSPYEAAAWSVLSQRIRIVQAARLRENLVARHGDEGAFPAPQRLRELDLDLPGRKAEYLHAVAEAALDGRLDAATLRGLDPDEAIRTVQGSRSVRGRARRGPWRERPRRLPTAGATSHRRDRRTLRYRPKPGRDRDQLATLPHLGGRPPAGPSRGTHAGDHGAPGAERRLAEIRHGLHRRRIGELTTDPDGDSAVRAEIH
jgi:DNA-3-methyladenine glycosylase II